MGNRGIAVATPASMLAVAAHAEVRVYGNLEGGVLSANKGAGTRYTGSGEWNATALGFKGQEDMAGNPLSPFISAYMITLGQAGNKNDVDVRNL
jgi:predicted porin